MIPEIGQGTILKPFQQPHPPIVVTAVAPGSKGAAEAAKRGWDIISANFLLPAVGADPLGRYVEGARRVGAAPTRPTGASRRRIFVADDEATARDTPSASAARTASTSSSWLQAGPRGPREPLQARPDMPDSEVTTDYCSTGS